MSKAKDEGSNRIFIRHNYSFAGKLLGKIDQLSVDNAIIFKDCVSFDPEGPKCKTKGKRNPVKSRHQEKDIPKIDR